MGFEHTTTTTVLPLHPDLSYAPLLLKRWIYVLVKSSSDFILPYTPERLNALAACKLYPPAFFALLDKFCHHLAADASWPAGCYYPGGWYRSLAAQGADVSSVIINLSALSPFYFESIWVDQKGHWQLGNTPLKERFTQHFVNHLQYDHELGRYYIQRPLNKNWESYYIGHQSPPLQVKHLVEDAQHTHILLNNRSSLPLPWNTLSVDAEEQLYCTIPPHQMLVRFQDKPRWALLKNVLPTQTGWKIAWHGECYPLHMLAG